MDNDVNRIGNAPEETLPTGNYVVFNESIFTLKKLLSLARHKLIIPKYHVTRVWNDNQKIAFIECLYIEGMHDPIVLYQLKNGKYEVIDGVERIRAMIDFYACKLTLANLSLFEELEGAKYSDVPFYIKERFL
ncbi:MAG: DUF262 domain-containing protein [Clostridiales bacterium]|nr:DUF262 domain-containing protein [Clostridiales bacterium]